MSTGYVGEIRLFTGQLPPSGWLLCNGATLDINEYLALHSIIGSHFGGDGRGNFKVPDFRGAVPVGANNNEIPYLTSRSIEKSYHYIGMEGKALSGNTSADDPGWVKQGSITVNFIICYEGIYPSNS
jgi:microcystin-dependent protein